MHRPYDIQTGEALDAAFDLDNYGLSLKDNIIPLKITQLVEKLKLWKSEYEKAAIPGSYMSCELMSTPIAKTIEKYFKIDIDEEYKTRPKTWDFSRDIAAGLELFIEGLENSHKSSTRKIRKELINFCCTLGDKILEKDYYPRRYLMAA